MNLNFGVTNLQNNEPSEHRTFGTTDLRNIEPSEQRTFGTMDLRKSERSPVRSSLEYSSAVWDPFRQKDIDKLEKNQRSAARFVTQNYRQTASVTSLIQNLDWTDLKTRRKNSRLVSMFKRRCCWSTKSKSKLPK